MNHSVIKEGPSTLAPQDVNELVRAINNICTQTATQINQICGSINQTNTTIIRDREIASVGVSALADSLHDAQVTQREINKELFEKIGGLSEAMLAQSKITARQTEAIGDVTKAINKLANEFSEHRGKSEEREKTTRQYQQHTKDSLERIGDKVDKVNVEADEIKTQVQDLATRVTVIEISRKEKSGFLDSTFTKTIAILTLLSATGIGLAAIYAALSTKVPTP